MPECYDGSRDWPLVVALHGGSGRGDEFLWTWLREVRGRRFLLLAPTSLGSTWSLDAPALDGEAGYSVLERLWIRPTCEVNGLLSGYTGQGAKTVLPAKAMAKVSFRLVPDQNPARVAELVRARIGAAKESAQSSSG